MTWREWMTARQMLNEEVVGTLVREQSRAEQDEFKRSADALRHK